MGKMIYRTEKVSSAGEVSGREHEANRTKEDIGRFENSDINWELTETNHDFKTTHNWVDAVKQKCAELDCPIKKDSVLILDHLITASPEWLNAQSDEMKMQFFTDAKEWLVDEFCGGDESLLLNCRIHKDESNWHMCAATIPIVKNPVRTEEELAKLKRKPRQKEYSLNAKKIMGGRGDYSARQQRVEDKIGKKYGLEAREVREQGEAKKHQTVQQAKLNALKQEVERAEKELEATMQQNRQVVKKQVEEAKQTISLEKGKAQAAIAERIEAEAALKAIEEILKEKEIQLGATAFTELKAKAAEKAQREQAEREAKMNANKVNALYKICIGRNSHGEEYTLGEFIDKTKANSQNMSEFVGKLVFVFTHLNQEPINDLWLYVQDKGRLCGYNRSQNGKDDMII